MSETENKKWIYCNHCKGVTRHVWVASHSYGRGWAEEDGTDEWGEYILWACAGCDTGTMEDHYTAVYLPGDEYNCIFHPKRAHADRAQKQFCKLPQKLQTLYQEVISALNESLNLLCAAGLRGLVEGVCADKGIQGSNLGAKIEGMKSLLPENIVKNLHGFRFMGNRAAHELEAPNNQELALAVDVIEDIFNFLYELDYKATLFGTLKASQARGDPVVRSVGTSTGEDALPASLPDERKS